MPLVIEWVTKPTQTQPGEAHKVTFSTSLFSHAIRVQIETVWHPAVDVEAGQTLSEEPVQIPDRVVWSTMDKMLATLVKDYGLTREIVLKTTPQCSEARAIRTSVLQALAKLNPVRLAVVNRHWNEA